VSHHYETVRRIYEPQECNSGAARAGAKPGNHHKDKGNRRERQAKAVLEADGWLVVKAGGSLGLFDLVALHVDYGVLLVQVKSNRPPARAEMDALHAFQCHSSWRKELWVYVDREGWKVKGL